MPFQRKFFHVIGKVGIQGLRFKCKFYPLDLVIFYHRINYGREPFQFEIVNPLENDRW